MYINISVHYILFHILVTNITQVTHLLVRDGDCFFVVAVEFLFFGQLGNSSDIFNCFNSNLSGIHQIPFYQVLFILFHCFL